MNLLKNNIIKDTDCLICSNNSYIEIYNKTHKVKSGLSTLVFDQHIIVCSNCGLARLSFNDTYSNENLTEYYKNTYRTPVNYTNIHPSDVRILYAANRINFIKKLGAEKKYFEIGFGDGQTIIKAIENGFNVTAIDPSEGYSYVNEHIEKLGATVIRGNFDENNQIQDSFDVVSAFLVLEHIQNPIAFLTNIKKILSKDGLLIIEVPDIKNYQLFLSDTILTFEHLFHYTIETLSALLSKLDFELVDYSSPGMSYPFTLTAAFKHKSISFATIPSIDGKTAVNYFQKYFDNMADRETALKNILDNEFSQKEDNKVFALFGIGNFTEYLAGLVNFDLIKKFDFIIDETPQKIGGHYNGIEIFPLEILKTRKVDKILIGSETFYEMISDKIKKINPTVECIKIK